MTKLDLPPLAQDVRALLDRAATIQAAPVAAKERIRARIDDLWGPSGGDAGIDARGAPTVAARATFVRRLLPLAASFAISGGVGALLLVAGRSSGIRSPSPRIVYIERSTAAPAPAPAAIDRAGEVPTRDTPIEIIQTQSAPHERPRLLHAMRSAAPSSSTPDPVIAERNLLDEARRALQRHDGAAALDVTKRHERQFPNGALVQEREAIAIRALVLLDLRPEARGRAQRFVTHFPHSVLRPTVESIAGAEMP